MRKVVRRRVRRRGGAVDVVGDVNVVIASSSAQPGSTVHSSSRSRLRVVQGPEGSQVVEESDDDDEGDEAPG